MLLVVQAMLTLLLNLLIVLDIVEALLRFLSFEAGVVSKLSEGPGVLLLRGKLLSPGILRLALRLPRLCFLALHVAAMVWIGASPVILVRVGRFVAIFVEVVPLSFLVHHVVAATLMMIGIICTIRLCELIEATGERAVHSGIEGVRLAAVIEIDCVDEVEDASRVVLSIVRDLVHLREVRILLLALKRIFPCKLAMASQLLLFTVTERRANPVRPLPDDIHLWFHHPRLIEGLIVVSTIWGKSLILKVL